MCTAIYVLYFYFLCWYDVIGVSMVGDESSLDPLSVTLLRDEDRWFSCHKYCAKHTDFHMYTHIQNTASAPSHPIQHSTAGESTPMTSMGLVMAGYWQINSILTNIGRRHSIWILNQYPFSEIHQYEHSLFVL